MLAISVLAALISDIKPKTDARSLRVGAALAIICVLVGVQAFGAVRVHRAAWQEQLARIAKAKEAGEERVQIRSVPSSTRFAMDIALADDAAQWPNSTLGKYYGVRIVGE